MLRDTPFRPEAVDKTGLRHMRIIPIVIAIIGLALATSAAICAVDEESAYCGACHVTELDGYSQDVHGAARSKGITDAPGCTDCHGGHSAEPPEGAPTESLKPAYIIKTCANCHENKELQKVYGLETRRLETYRQSYHGIADKYGNKSSANCASCHGSHGIYPASSPKSPINKANIGKTCGKCHPGASSNLALGSVHVMPSASRDSGVYWVQRVYTYMIFGIVGGCIAYIGLDVVSRWRRRNQREDES
jgi:nitrate/TMAO reductase-like tetraheme cytochrome c subunit